MCPLYILHVVDVVDRFSSRSHLEAARGKLDERLVQTHLMMGHYQSLGEAFSELADQYHEILTDIENKQWALTELSKTNS